ncbi:MAG: hypothetical protein QNJ54_28310 [Prochloraceae cyanobacterium]|nr:hypothetical protein [Prochloraceae cyanobacterium]
MKATTDKTNLATTIIPTRPGIQLSNCKKGGVGKTLLSKLKAAYCLESGLDFYAVDADKQESFLKAYPEFALPTRFSELDRNLKIPDRILDLALEKLVIVDLPGNVEEAFNHWLNSGDILEAANDLGVEIQNWYLLDDSTECYEGFWRTWEFLGNNVRHILVRNLGRCEDWESFERFITPELINKHKLKVIDLPKLRLDTATTVYKNTLSFTQARRYPEFSTAQLAGLRGYLRRVYGVLDSVGFNVESLRIDR